MWWAYWREWVFVLSAIVLTIGLLAVSAIAEGAERLVCLIMLAIITFSIFIGGVAWMAGARSSGPPMPAIKEFGGTPAPVRPCSRSATICSTATWKPTGRYSVRIAARAARTQPAGRLFKSPIPRHLRFFVGWALPTTNCRRVVGQSPPCMSLFALAEAIVSLGILLGWPNSWAGNRAALW